MLRTATEFDSNFGSSGSRGVPVWLLRLTPRPAHHEISIPLPAFGTAQQPRPIGDGPPDLQAGAGRFVEVEDTRFARCLKTPEMSVLPLKRVG